MIEDITVIYLSASTLPKPFAEYVRGVLLEAIGNTPLISITREPLDFGMNILDDGERCIDNIYRQLLRGAKLATTKYIVTAEDDTLYHTSHFRFYRPADNTVGYDKNRFTLFTWGDPIFHWRDRLSNCSLIAPREYLIESLEERFAKYPDRIPERMVGEVGRGMVERNLGVTVRNCEEVYNKISLIQVNHDFSSEERQRSHRKSYGPLRAYDLFYWRKASDIVEKYHKALNIAV